MARARSRTRLSRENWIEAALQALADGGPRELGWFMQRLVEGSERATPRERAAYERRAIEILTARS
jgi:hypothetical protein